jgi:hypothetical protein
MRGLFGGNAIELLFKFVGAVLVGFAYLLYHAARDPVRYVAVIDVFAFVVIAGVITDVYAALTYAPSPPFLRWLIWGRALLRLVIAALLITWQPGKT